MGTVVADVNGVQITEEDVQRMGTDLLDVAAADESMSTERRMKVSAFLSLFFLMLRSNGGLDRFIELANDCRDVDAKIIREESLGKRDKE